MTPDVPFGVNLPTPRQLLLYTLSQIDPLPAQGYPTFMQLVTNYRGPINEGLTQRGLGNGSVNKNPYFDRIQLHYPTSPASADTRLSSHLLELDQEGLLRFVGGAHPCLAVTPPGNRSARKIQDMLLELDMQLDFRGLDYILTTETGESDLRIYPATRYRSVWKIYDPRFFDEPWNPRFRPLSSMESYPPGFFATLGTWGTGLVR